MSSMGPFAKRPSRAGSARAVLNLAIPNDRCAGRWRCRESGSGHKARACTSFPDDRSAESPQPESPGQREAAPPARAARTKGWKMTNHDRDGKGGRIFVLKRLHYPRGVAKC